MEFHREVTGDIIGPFLVHREASAYLAGWVVTHRATGYAVLNEIPEERSAKWLARELQKVQVSWDFSEPAAVKSLSAEALAKIKVLRAEARRGSFRQAAA
ncbi:hypothetical protein ASE10_10525 [Lysobacter sp. Root76]|nr:hypothetical protein ASE10_10525 [Lysobacter sp. Root76]